MVRCASISCRSEIDCIDVAFHNHRDKDRLYVTLHARGGQRKMPGGEDRYHWALLVGPKVETLEKEGTRFHAKNPVGLDEWTFEEVTTPLGGANMILARILIGKIRDTAGLGALLRQVPVDNETLDWNCISWVQDALKTLARDDHTMGRCVLDWDHIRKIALEYCGQKIADGRFKAGGAYGPTSKVPTFDMLSEKEVIS